LFWNLDNDVIAGDIGNYIEKNQIEGIKMIKYEGGCSPYGLEQIENENPDLLNVSIYDKRNFFNNNIHSPRSQKLLKEHWNIFKDYKKLERLNYYKLLRGIDSDFFEKVKMPWQKEQMKRYKVRFGIELHSTHQRNDSPFISFSTTWQNGKMRSLLKEYRKRTLERLPNNPIAFQTSELTGSCIAIHDPGLYHCVVIEAEHGSELIECSSKRDEAIKNYNEVILDFSQFLRKEYPK